MVRALLLSLCLTLFWCPSLAAHPHVFIANRFVFALATDRVTHVEVEWEFDEFFTAMIREDFDLDMDGVLSREEIEGVRVDAFDHLKESAYFSRLDIDGRETAVCAGDFSARLEGDFVVYSYRIPLPDRPMKEVRLAQYDESYYAALLLAKERPVTLSGNTDGARFEIRENPDRTYYFGALHPVEARITLGEATP